MLKLKSVVVAIDFGIVAVGLMFTSARAGFIRFTDNTGQLTGAHGVFVAGRFYDVEFIDGICEEVFDGCDNALIDFAFQDQVTAFIASQALLSSFIQDHGSRITRGAVVSGGKKVADFAGVQTRLAEASGALDAAKRMTFRDLDETFGAVKAGRHVSIDMRIRNRLTHTYTAKLALDAMNGLYAATGAAGLYTNGRIQRAWRDITAASHHVSPNWDAVSTMFGQNALGIEPQGQF